MVSLIVKLHVVKDYIKSAKNVDIAGKIGAEVLQRSKEDVKKHVGRRRCMCIPRCFALSNCSEGTYSMEQNSN